MHPAPLLTTVRQRLRLLSRRAVNGHRVTPERLVRTGSGYLSQSERPVTFGLGAHAAADELIVEWPSGAKEKTGPLTAGRFYTITEGRGITSTRPLSRP